MKRDLTWMIPVLAALVLVATHLMWRGELPDRVATHFNGTGQADGWMTKAGHRTFSLGLGLGVAAFVVVLCRAVRFFPPSLLNVPNAAFWRSPEHYPEACEMVARWGNGFAAALLVFLTLVNGLVVRANRTDPPHLDGALLAVCAGGFVLFAIGWIVWLVVAFSRKPSGSP